MIARDAQVRAHERDHPGSPPPGAAVFQGPPEVSGADMVAAMNSVGVDAAGFAIYHVPL